MKNLFSALFTFCILINLGCKDIMPVSTPNNFIEGKHLEINGIKSYIPEEIKAQMKCRYSDQSGDTKELKVRYKDQVTPRILSGQSYTSDEIEITLYDESDPLFQIVIIGSANYDSDYSILYQIAVLMMPANPSGEIFSWIRFDEFGQPIVTMFDDFHSTVTLNNKSFKDCFLMKGTNPDAYSEIYINSEIGVVGFRDAKNELFVFKEYIE